MSFPLTEVGPGDGLETLVPLAKPRDPGQPVGEISFPHSLLDNAIRLYYI